MIAPSVILGSRAARERNPRGAVPPLDAGRAFVASRMTQLPFQIAASV